MEVKNVLGWVIGLAALGLTVWVVAKAWKAGSK